MYRSLTQGWSSCYVDRKKQAENIIRLLSVGAFHHQLPDQKINGANDDYPL
jgi:hypothetical protein